MLSLTATIGELILKWRGNSGATAAMRHSSAPLHSLTAASLYRRVGAGIQTANDPHQPNRRGSGTARLSLTGAACVRSCFGGSSSVLGNPATAVAPSAAKPESILASKATNLSTSSLKQQSQIYPARRLAAWHSNNRRAPRADVEELDTAGRPHQANRRPRQQALKPAKRQRASLRRHRRL